MTITFGWCGIFNWFHWRFTVCAGMHFHSDAWHFLFFTRSDFLLAPPPSRVSKAPAHPASFSDTHWHPVLIWVWKLGPEAFFLQTRFYRVLSIAGIFLTAVASLDDIKLSKILLFFFMSLFWCVIYSTTDKTVVEPNRLNFLSNQTCKFSQPLCGVGTKFEHSILGRSKLIWGLQFLVWIAFFITAQSCIFQMNQRYRNVFIGINCKIRVNKSVSFIKKTHLFLFLTWASSCRAAIECNSSSILEILQDCFCRERISVIFMLRRVTCIT